MKFDRFDVTVWAVLGLIGAALGGVILNGDRVGARIVRTLPPAEQEVGAFQRIGLEFAQAMQAGSVADHFSLEPEAQGALLWEGRQLWFAPQQPFEPGVQYTARLSPGALSQGGQEVKQEVSWTFQVRAPAIVFVSPANSPHELWRMERDGSQARQLTDTGGDVYDFSVSRDGAWIAFSALNDQRGLDLWLVSGQGGAPRLLVDCGLDRCTAPTWAPDGSRVAFSREGSGLAPDAPHGPPRVWTVEVASGQDAQLYQDSQVLGYGPSWSPDGRRLAFFDGASGGIRVLDLQTSAEMILPSWMGVVGAWSADGSRMLYNDLSVAEERPYARLYIADFEDQSVSPALGEGEPQADFSIPAWSPDGQWLVVSLRLGQQAPNEQLWLMRPDGSQAQQITFDRNYTYGRYQWDPWGRRVIFQRLELGVSYPVPEIMVWEIGQDEPRPLRPDSTWPAWLP